MKRILLGHRYRERLDAALRRLGLEPLYLPDNPHIDPRLAGHADLSVFREGERIWLAPSLRDTNIPSILEKAGYSVSFPDIRQEKAYPKDAQLNLCTVGKRLFYAIKASSPEIVMELTISGGYQPVPVRQGYIRCSCCPVDDGSLMTADRGLARAAQAFGLQVLQLTPGYVSLPGFAYGFLGGTAFKFDDQTLLFTGDIRFHPDGKRILHMLSERGIAAYCLTNEPLLDIGGAILF